MALTIDFAGRTVLVTGGTKGVGRGIATRFADAGATVVVCARNQPTEPLPDGWHFLSADIRDAEQAAAVVDAARDLGGRLDFVVNNAGGTSMGPAATAPARVSERVIELNLLAPLYIGQAANRHMQEQDSGGAIVHIGSVTALRPAPLAAAYGAAKAGLLNLTMSQAMEWAPKVRVNYMVCGMIRTEQSHVYYGDEAGIERVGATVPLGRLAHTSEIGDVAVWLASPMSSYVTGAAIAVHGGGDRPPFIDAAQS
jgi:NAD(P)-dependent dehydrogenase (short-subunit alcohol dehydrogenase family)